MLFLPCSKPAARCAALLAALCFAGAVQAAEPVHISLIAINDFHGNIQPPSGSDALSVFKQGRNVQEGETDLVAAKLYFRIKGILPRPQMGRIQRIT